jgi:UDP-glucuronate 4-epimerase
MHRTILVTGGAGFIGSHVCEMLAHQSNTVVALDNLNPYYDPARKRANLEEVRSRTRAFNPSFVFIEGDVRDRALLAQVTTEYRFDAIVHLAAMAGVRASIVDPADYYDVNVNGTLAILDLAAGRLGSRFDDPPSVVLASTSSVYGDTAQIPFIETDVCDRPLAPYAASKRAAEILAYTYSYLYRLPTTVLRFFTVYGPRGRPDMMPFKVVDSITLGTTIPLYNDGQMLRDWTYVSDVASGVIAASARRAQYEIINIGRGEPVLLANFVRLIEERIGRAAHLVAAPPPDTDMRSTHADIHKARRLLGYNPQISRLVRECRTAV